VTGVGGEAIPLDSATLRFLVDEEYAAMVRARTEQLQPTREQLRELAELNPPPQDWSEQLAGDVIRDSWK
jgi:hypothetical protein